MQLPDLIRLLRGEVESDPSPNKALAVPRDLPTWEHYRYKSRWDSIVQHGVVPSWRAVLPPQAAPPPNHGSARRAFNALVKNIRKGQDDDRYLVLDIDLIDSLEGIFCSPFGAVPKGDKTLSEEARVIHDLSFPDQGSVNDATTPDAEIDINYDGARAIASRIEAVEQQFPSLARLMSGDVNGAFRHIPLHADHCGKFAGTIPELGVLVIDLCCPFGWRNSPAAYAVAGGAINHVYMSSQPMWPHQPVGGKQPFDGKVWCDDHNCVEPSIGTRLPEASLALRASMVRVLGPTACNEEKFTPWVVCGSALGLDWDLQRRTVSIPTEKIEKARRRARELLDRPRASRSQLNRLLGSLRHVATCVRSASSFFQRLADAQRRMPKFGTFPLPLESQDDLKWFLAILGAAKLNGIPLARFTHSQVPTVEVLMDASDAGLCALYPARQQFLQVRFDYEELKAIRAQKSGLESNFGINTRELMSAVFAALVWGHLWSNGSSEEVHVRMRIDNTSAVAWNNRRLSRNAFAQMLLRILALHEAQHNFYVTADHIPGVENVMADAGSYHPTELAETLAGLGALLRAGALADSSRRAYSRSWTQWLSWCRFMEYSPWLPRDANAASTAQLGAFAVYLWKFGMNRRQEGNSYGTICSKLCAVRWRHRLECGYDPGVTAQHALLLRGIRRFTNPVLKQQPLTPRLLHRIYSRLDISHPRNQLLWGGVLLAYFFLLRRSEYLFIGKKYHPYVLRLGDIRFCTHDGQAVKPRHATVVGILLRGAKNNQFGREEFRYLHTSNDALLCPVLAARWIKMAAKRFGTHRKEPALRLSKSSGVSSREVATIIKAAAMDEGLDAVRFSTHSVRIGGATKLLNAGTDRLVIKLLGRWLSSCYEDYPVLTSEGTAGLSQLMCQ